jgi:hypothetical protein
MYQVSSGGRFGVGVSGDALVGKKEGMQCKVGAGRRFGRRLGCCGPPCDRAWQHLFVDN